VQLGGRGSDTKLAVRAPIAGRVVDLAAGAGGYWNDTAAPLMVVADLARVVVTANAREQEIARIEEGQAVTLRFNGFAGETAARVGTLGWMLDADTRTLKVRIPVDNRAGRLRPGMFASAAFAAPAHRGILVPLAAVVQDGFATRAYVEVAPWRFEARTVQLGAQVDGRVEVTAGLAAGQRIVVQNGVLLND
jgi:cobalt-zinc-cadmium efflux system membrane fusion protein